jgi:hypothetical protein
MPERVVVLPNPLFIFCRAEAYRDVPPVARKSANAFLLHACPWSGTGTKLYNSVIFVDRTAR